MSGGEDMLWYYARYTDEKWKEVKWEDDFADFFEEGNWSLMRRLFSEMKRQEIELNAFVSKITKDERDFEEIIYENRREI